MWSGFSEIIKRYCNIEKKCEKSLKWKLFSMERPNKDIQQHSILMLGQCVYTTMKYILNFQK